MVHTMNIHMHEHKHIFCLVFFMLFIVFYSRHSETVVTSKQQSAGLSAAVSMLFSSLNALVIAFICCAL